MKGRGENGIEGKVLPTHPWGYDQPWKQILITQARQERKESSRSHDLENRVRLGIVGTPEALVTIKLLWTDLKNRPG